MGTNSIWSTAECDAWARGFDYEGYLHSLKLKDCTHAPLDEQGYSKLCAIFDSHLERGMHGAN